MSFPRFKSILESGETYFGRFSRHFSTRIKRIWRIFLILFREIRVHSCQDQKTPVSRSILNRIIFGSGIFIAVMLLLPLSSSGNGNYVSDLQNPRNVLHVPEDFDTIAEALGAAQPGDTVQVASGVYTQSESIYVPPGVSLIGAGWRDTIITGRGIDTVVRLSQNTLIKGFTIQNSGTGYFDAGIWISQGTVTIQENRITDNTAGIWAWCFDPDTCAIDVTVEKNIIDRNRSNAINSNDPVVFHVRNNTIADNGGSGLILNNKDSIAVNNIIVQNGGDGIINNAASAVHHNDVWGNNRNYVGGDPGDGGLSMDPMFRNSDGADYRLHAGSPAIDHGSPDGTDMGAIPFSPVGTPPTNVHVIHPSSYTWTVAWDKVTSAAGYHVYLGAAPGYYTQHFDVGVETSLELKGLPGDLTYYVAVSSYDANGDESNVSSEASFFVPPAPAGRYEETSPAIVTRGNWTQISDPQASGGGYIVSETAGDSVQITFSGESVVLYRRMDVDGGRASVSIDNQSFGYVEFYFLESRWQVPAIFDHLGPGAHTLTLTVASDADANSTGHRVWVDAFAIPNPYQPSYEQLQALERVNWYRQMAGLPLVEEVGPLNMSAQAHADYDVNNQKTDGHEEKPEKPGYVGQWPSDRANYFGYLGGVGEDMHGIGDPISSVDGWMATVYHRNLIMDYGMAEMGYGMAERGRYRSDVLDMGSRFFSRHFPPSRKLITYPASNQQDVPHLWSGGEYPDPLPGKPKPVGYPVSLYIAQPSGAMQLRQQLIANAQWVGFQKLRSAQWQVSTAELRDDQGNAVPVYELDQANDSHLGPDVVFLIAHEPLKLGTTYTAHIAGVDSRGNAFDHSWSFTTISATAVSDIHVDAGACGARIDWNTAGETTTWIEYGKTTDYGTKIRGESSPGIHHSARLPDLDIETIYHYRIVSQDEDGNTSVTEDRTFATRQPATYRAPEQYSTIQDALNVADYCDVVQVESGLFHGHLTIPEKVTLRGAGADQTTIDGGGADGSVVSMKAGSEISDFTITGSGSGYFDSGIWHSQGNVRILRNRITGNQVGVFSWCFDAGCDVNTRIQNNVIDHNARIGVDANQTSIQHIINNTIVSNGRGVVLNNAASIAENNIIVNNTGDGLVGGARDATSRYNDVWHNGRNYLSLSPGTGGISADPLFLNATQHNYHLLPNSPARDAGNPDPAYDDVDGTRNDMGRYGGPLALTPCDLEGDLDGNYIVNGDDLKIIADHWRKTATSPGWNPEFDINQDGIIDVRDVLELAPLVGEACP